MISYIKGERPAKNIENRLLGRMFGPKSNENGEWRKLHNRELHSLYCISNVIRVIKSRRFRWTGNEKCNCMENLQGKYF